MPETAYERYDLSDTLIHFVRKAQLESDQGYDDEMFAKEFDDAEFVEDTTLSPFFLLRRIVRKRQILATWSVRGGKRTIYGRFPAVCFTEMPIAEFVKSSVSRGSRGENISSYAIILPKKKVFELGGRPVIYGTSTPVSTTTGADGVRTIVPAVFGDDELYRYVTSNLTRQPVPIDWSHEREWRWPNRDYRFVNIDNAEPEDAEARKLRDLREETRVDFHGLNLDEAGVRGVGLIVKNQNQADLLVRDILWLVDAGLVTPHLYRYILLLPVLKKRLSKIHQPAQLRRMISSHLIDLSPYLSPDPAIDKAVASKLKQISKRIASQDFGNVPAEFYGIAYPCLRSNRTELARSLVRMKLIRITRLGRYLVDIPAGNRYDHLGPNEALAQEIASDMEAAFGVGVTYYSVSGLYKKKSKADVDINDLPFYTEPDDEEWNYAHTRKDF